MYFDYDAFRKKAQYVHFTFVFSHGILGKKVTRCQKRAQGAGMTDTGTFHPLREKAGLSIDETAELIGKSPRTVRRYEDCDGTENSAPALVMDALKRIIRERSGQTRRGGENFRFIDLFAGIGGLRIPFEELGGKCVFTAEWDRFARMTYAANFPDGEDHAFVEDVRPYARDPEKVPAHDVLLAGFPCQPFSIAGVSKKNSLGRPHGFMCDTQGTLFHDLANIIKHHRPSVFLLENVKNLERHDGGKTFATIMHVLKEELKYEVHTGNLATRWLFRWCGPWQSL
jgi:DNA (cytosine-5)-methyltransferase 1